MVLLAVTAAGGFAQSGEGTASGKEAGKSVKGSGGKTGNADLTFNKVERAPRDTASAAEFRDWYRTRLPVMNAVIDSWTSDVASCDYHLVYTASPYALAQLQKLRAEAFELTPPPGKEQFHSLMLGSLNKAIAGVAQSRIASGIVVGAEPGTQADAVQLFGRSASSWRESFRLARRAQSIGFEDLKPASSATEADKAVDSYSLNSFKAAVQLLKAGDGGDALTP